MDIFVIVRLDMNVESCYLAHCSRQPAEPSGMRIYSDDVHFGVRFQSLRKLVVGVKLLVRGMREYIRIVVDII